MVFLAAVELFFIFLSFLSMFVESVTVYKNSDLFFYNYLFFTHVKGAVEEMVVNCF